MLYINILNTLISVAKIIYLKQQFELSYNNTKTTCKLINEATFSTKKPSLPINVIFKNDSMVTDNNEILNYIK